MGQQQLLLLILTTVIVGLATVAGIEVYQARSTEAEMDRLRNLAVRIISKAKVKAKQPKFLGGAGGRVNKDWTKTQSMSSLGYETTTNNEYMKYGNGTGVYKTEAGECVLSQHIVDAKHANLAPGGQTLTITCASDEAYGAASIAKDPNRYDSEYASITRQIDNTP